MTRKMALAAVTRSPALSEAAAQDVARDVARDYHAALTAGGLAVSMALDSHGQPMYAAAGRRRLDEVKQGLGFETATPLERLLIEQIALCDLRLGEAEMMYSQIVSRSHSPEKSLYVERRLSACQRRMMNAVEGLARVRRLMRATPAVQVNIAGQQIVARGG
jgi:hypothetical protein